MCAMAQQPRIRVLSVDADDAEGLLAADVDGVS
jgi:hypothetical protein